jgi:FkbM family methyltransferase
MTEASDPKEDRPRRRGLLQNIRDLQQTLDCVRALDWASIQRQLTKAEQTLDYVRALDWARIQRQITKAEQTLDYVQALDWAGVQQQVSKTEQALRRIDATQRTVLGGIREARLISPLELASTDRFVLENRCRALTNPVYLGDHTALSRVLGFYKIYLDTTDTGFASHLLLDGFWEMWLTIFLASQVKTGMTVIDVGANFGYYTLLFGALVGAEGRVYAVEPNPEVIPKLQRSVDLNGLAQRTTIIKAAAGATDGGEVELYVPNNEPKNAMVVASGRGIEPGAGRLHKVPRIRLDKLAQTMHRVDLVKIDAEGAEEDVIAGMEQILRRDKSKLILEFNARRYADPAGFLDRLNSMYGRMHYIDFDCSAREVSREKLARDESGEDWILYFDQPPPPDESLAAG